MGYVRHGHVYAIKNNAINHVYVGRAMMVGERYDYHVSHLRRNKHPNKYLQEDFNKYGERAFSFEIVAEVEVEWYYAPIGMPARDEMIAKLAKIEHEWIAKFSEEERYNISK